MKKIPVNIQKTGWVMDGRMMNDRCMDGWTELIQYTPVQWILGTEGIMIP